jgi:hypothetical protein
MYNTALNHASRLLWAVVGTALVASGTRPRSVWEAGCGAAGCAMLLWAIAAPSVPGDDLRDIVDISSEDSFPASDPPSTW